MAPKYAALNAMTDEELIERHDNLADTTGLSLNFYRDELNRRANERATAAAQAEARAARKLAFVNMWVAIVAVAVAVATMVLQVALTDSSAPPCFSVQAVR